MRLLLTSLLTLVAAQAIAQLSRVGSDTRSIEIVDFSTTVNASNTVDIRWVTSSETDNDYFTVEKTTDGMLFEEVCIIQSQGNSTQQQTYVCTDQNPVGGTSYYRLKQVKLNGSATYTDMNAVTVESSAILVYSNSFEQNAPVRVTGILHTHTLYITDMNGKTIYTAALSDFDNTIYLTTVAGIYQFMLVNDKEVVKTGKMLIK